jgi:hypothetical protein
MKLLRLLPCAIAFSLAAHAASTTRDTNTSTSAVMATASVTPGNPSVPQSVFDNSPALKDPFFPKSTRRIAQSQIQPLKTTSSPSELASLLTLNGVSGSSSQRLAIINGRTMGAGESFEFNTPRGKLKVRCLEVRSSSVLIALGTEENKVEIKLRD